MYCYFLDNGVVNRITQRNGFSHLELRTSIKGDKVPTNIEIINKRIKLSIRLKLIKVE